MVCAFALAKAGVRGSDLPNSRKKKIEADIPHAKALKDYPAVLLARLGVSEDFRSLHIGSDILSYITMSKTVSRQCLAQNNKKKATVILNQTYHWTHA